MRIFPGKERKSRPATQRSRLNRGTVFTDAESKYINGVLLQHRDLIEYFVRKLPADVHINYRDEACSELYVEAMWGVHTYDPSFDIPMNVRLHYVLTHRFQSILTAWKKQAKYRGSHIVLKRRAEEQVTNLLERYDMDFYPSTTETPDEILGRAELVELVHQLETELVEFDRMCGGPDQVQPCLLERFVNGTTLPDLGNLHGTSITTVAAYINRMLPRIKKRMLRSE